MPPHPRERVHIPLKDRIKDGRTFQTSRRTDSGIVYLRCRTRHCAATAKKMPDGNIITLREHSRICYPDENAQLKADFVDALKSALERNFWKLKEVYETVVVMFPREIKVQIPFHTIKSSLKRWRRRFYPPCPESLASMGFQLLQPENQRLLEYDVGRLSAKTIYDDNGDLHVLICDSQFVETEFANASRLFIDGTFKTKPRVTGLHQLVSVLGVRYDHAIPFAHILMSKKTECAYRAVLTEITTNLINSQSVSVVMMDYEQALRNASKTVFVNAFIAGCNMHYDQALFKKIKSLHLRPLLRDNEQAKLFFKKIMALAFLPSEMIEGEYEELVNTLPLPLKRSFSPFLNYYSRQWLRIVKPAGFSVFGLSRRTNNVTESYNSVLLDKVGENPSAWTFIGKLVKLTSNARDDVRSLAMGKRIKRHPRYSTVFKQQELIKTWRQLRSEELTVAEFLSKITFLKGHVLERLTRIRDEPEEDEVELNSTTLNIPSDDPDYDREIVENPVLDDLIIDNVQGGQVQALAHESDLDDTDSSSVGSETGVEREEENQRDSEADDESEIFLVDENPENVENMRNADQRSLAATPEPGASSDESEPNDVVRDGHDPDNISEDAGTVQTPNKASFSRKKNLKKKRLRQRKAENQGNPVRPYGHKRRKRNNKKQGPKCVVCLEKPVSHGFVPCGHNCCCESCAVILAAAPQKKCPKCRTHFRECLRIFNEN